MSDYGVTNQGFAIKSFQVIQNEIQTEFGGMFGTNIDVSVNSPEGQIINNFCLKLANAWEVLLAIYSMFNPNSAEGIALDAVCAGNGISRNAATAAVVPILHYGVSGTVIQSGNLARDTNLNEYSLEADTTISLVSVADASIECPTPTGDEIYTVILNGVSISYTAQDGDIAYVIYTNLRNLINNTPNIDAVIIAFIDTDTGLLRIQAIDGGFTSFVLAVSSNLTINTYGTPGDYKCTKVGSFQPLANSITTIVNAVTGLVSINNITGGNSGTEEETDEQLRARRLIELVAKSGSSDLAIASTLPKIVDDVTYCTCISNRSDNMDTAGRPPHSLEITVEGGDPLLIAQAIWKLAPSGIQFYGNTSQSIVDSNGDTQIIYFTRPTPLYIWLIIVVTHSAKISLPVNAVQAIQTLIMNWATQNVAVNTDILIDVIRGVIYQCLGVATVPTLEIGYSSSASIPPVSYGTTNVSVGLRQLPAFDPSRMDVTVE